MYVCGPTVDNLPHLGHGRFTLVWDVARRWFTFRGLDVHYVSNVTDIDDKIIARAHAEDRAASTTSSKQYEGEWWDAMDALGVAEPDDAPHATDYVGGHGRADRRVPRARRRLRHERRRLLRRVDACPTTGCSPASPSTAFAPGARVEANDEKRSPLDFALWKNAKPGEPTLARALRRGPTGLAHRVRGDVARSLG